MKARTKKPDLKTRIGKYAIARLTAKTKQDAAIEAGYPDGTHVTRIENSKTYQAIVKTYFKDEILAKISMPEIADALADNIRQDKDRGARNKAIEIAKSTIEPDKVHDNSDERVLVILKQ